MKLEHHMQNDIPVDNVNFIKIKSSLELPIPDAVLTETFTAGIFSSTADRFSSTHPPAFYQPHRLRFFNSNVKVSNKVVAVPKSTDYQAVNVSTKMQFQY